jgi:3-dehydroquinate synthase
MYMRGVEVVQIPTTLLAQVDASVGGKTGVNLKAGKNLIGAFWQPRAVLIDPEVLSSLPAREYRAGLYEALKCGVIGNPELFREFENNRDKIAQRDPATVERLIAESVRLKAHVVSVDEKENGLRRVLNFGHTIGHALEAETGYRSLLHGEAVGWGMRVAVEISRMRGLPDAEAGRILAAIDALGLPPLPRLTPRRLLNAAAGDKKRIGGIRHFVLLDRIGHARVVDDLSDDDLLRAIHCGLKLER